ncbi:hypothetical protein ACFQI9_34120 [Paraburkholderia dipogonis]|uniref:hypothetical protein n=1 Tax=Paraburkholderia dipogonis TaxID=1211383 RepID=UPI0036115F27
MVDAYLYSGLPMPFGRVADTHVPTIAVVGKQTTIFKKTRAETREERATPVGDSRNSPVAAYAPG